MFSICIPTIRPNSVAATIESIRRQTRADWELLVVGQGDDAQLQAVVEPFVRADPRIHYLHLQAKGLSRARNLALRTTTAPLIAFIDDDCEAREDWLEAYGHYFERWSSVALIGGALIAPPKPRWKIGVCPETVPAEVVYDPVATPLQPPAGFEWYGGNFALRRSVIAEVGYFDEYLGVGAFYAAGEDSDYKMRLEMLGIPMGSTPNIVVKHTYGYRFGLRAAVAHARNYARGEGAVAAKLMMLDPARGALELRNKRRQVVERLLPPARAPKTLWRLLNYVLSYRTCIRTFRVDPSTKTLYPLRSPAHTPKLSV